MINYIWKITSLETVNTDDKPDYVVNTSYKVEAVDGSFTSEMRDVMSFKIDEGSSFIPYDQLTNDLVISWVKSTLGLQEIEFIEKSLADVIAYKKNPPVTPQVKPLPW